MQNIAEFRIIGRVGDINEGENVTHVSVAANYNRKVDGEWKTETYWNRVTCFKNTRERANDANKGDLVHITGRVRQSQYENDGETRYSVDLIAESFSVLTRAADKD